MKFLILHLSDLHIGERIDDFEDFFSNVYITTKNIASACDLVLIAITGDISNKSCLDGYLNANLLLSDLIEKYNNLKKPRIETIIVPGNHDCNFDEEIPPKEKAIRERLIRDIIKNEDGSNDIDLGTIEICTAPQKRAFEFISEFDSMSGAFQDNQIIWKKTINISDDVLNVFCINSAWMTSNPETQGKLILPENLISEYMQPSSGISITLMHHPISWFKPWSSKRLRDYIESCSNIVFSGHEHWLGSSVRSNEKSMITYYSDGSSLENSFSNLSNFYSYLIIKDSKDSYSLEKYILDVDNRTIIKGAQDDDQINTLTPREHKSYLTLTEKNKKFINDIGVNLRHPQVSMLTLEDVFIYPDFQILNPDPLKKISYEKLIINSENALEINKKSGSKFIILGQARSGRTTLLKKVYRNLLHDGYMPIWLEGSKIKSTNEKEILSVINKEAKLQYSNVDINEIIVFDNDKKVIIIDDFDESGIPRKLRRKYMDSLRENFINILLTSHELLEIEELTGNEPEASIIYDGFKLFQIKELGNYRRSLIIKKWFELSNDPYTDQNEQLRKLDAVTDIINRIIGKNLTPSYPFIILVLLQNITNIDPSNFQQSSYGYYYQALILESLKNINSSPEAINAFNTFLSSLAYSMFNSDHKYLDDIDFKKFCYDHSERHDIQNKIDIIVEEILLSEVLINNDGRYYFAYKYMFYFFTAQYFSDKISQPKIKKLITNMAQKPHNDNYSNILMFLSYLSKDPIIIESLLNAASMLFCDEKPIELDEDIRTLNELYKDMPKLVLNYISVEEARANHLKDKDNVDALTNKKEKLDDCIDTDDELNIVDKIFVSLKLAEIIGQVVKNSYASLEANDKLNLVENTYLLLLKPLGILLRFIMDNPEKMASEISKIMQTQPLYDTEDREIVEAYAIAHLSRVCSILTYTFISRVSQFVGSENLLVTYERLMNNKTTAYRLVDAVIKIDHFTKFPIAILRRLNKDLEHNPLAKIVLSQSVRKYLYMFEIVDIKYKQKICKEFDIEMPEIRKIEHISKDKKGER